MVRKHLIPALGRAKLIDLQRPAIRKIYREKKQSGLKSRTVEYIHVTLHKALNDAVGDRLLNYNPTEGLKLPHRKTPKRRRRLVLNRSARCFVQRVGAVLRHSTSWRFTRGCAVA